VVFQPSYLAEAQSAAVLPPPGQYFRLFKDENMVACKKLGPSMKIKKRMVLDTCHVNLAR
jgi:hypothetical protein